MKEKIFKVLNRLRNKKVFIAVISGILLILVNTGLITEEISENYLSIFNTAFSIGIALGVFSDSRTDQEKEE